MFDYYQISLIINQLTTFGNITILPSNWGISGVTPWTGFSSSRISAVVSTICHFRKNVFWRGRLLVWFFWEPISTRYLRLCFIHMSMIISARSFDTICLKCKNLFKLVRSYANGQNVFFNFWISHQENLLVARSHRMAVIDERVQDLFAKVELSYFGSTSHLGRRKWPLEFRKMLLLLLSSIMAQSL